MSIDPVQTLRCSFNPIDGFRTTAGGQLYEKRNCLLPESEADEGLNRASELDGGHDVELRSEEREGKRRGSCFGGGLIGKCQREASRLP